MSGSSADTLTFEQNYSDAHSLRAAFVSGSPPPSSLLTVCLNNKDELALLRHGILLTLRRLPLSRLCYLSKPDPIGYRLGCLVRAIERDVYTPMGIMSYLTRSPERVISRCLLPAMTGLEDVV